MNKFILILFLCFSTVVFSQEYNKEDVLRLIELSKNGQIHSEEYNKLLNRNPDVKQLILNHRRKKATDIKDIMNKDLFEYEHKYLLYLFEEETFSYIKGLWYSVINSKFAQDVSEVVTNRLEEETELLKQEAKKGASSFKK